MERTGNFPVVIPVEAQAPPCLFRPGSTGSLLPHPTRCILYSYLACNQSAALYFMYIFMLNICWMCRQIMFGYMCSFLNSWLICFSLYPRIWACSAALCCHDQAGSGSKTRDTGQLPLCPTLLPWLLHEKPPWPLQHGPP